MMSAKTCWKKNTKFLQTNRSNIPYSDIKDSRGLHRLINDVSKDLLKKKVSSNKSKQHTYSDIKDSRGLHRLINDVSKDLLKKKSFLHTKRSNIPYSDIEDCRSLHRFINNVSRDLFKKEYLCFLHTKQGNLPHLDIKHCRGLHRLTNDVRKDLFCVCFCGYLFIYLFIFQFKAGLSHYCRFAAALHSHWPQTDATLRRCTAMCRVKFQKVQRTVHEYMDIASCSTIFGHFSNIHLEEHTAHYSIYM